MSRFRFHKTSCIALLPARSPSRLLSLESMILCLMLVTHPSPIAKTIVGHCGVPYGLDLPDKLNPLNGTARACFPQCGGLLNLHEEVVCTGSTATAW